MHYTPRTSNYHVLVIVVFPSVRSFASSDDEKMQIAATGALATLAEIPEIAEAMVKAKVCSSQSAVALGTQHSALNSQHSALSSQQPAARYQLSAVGSQQSAVSSQLSAVGSRQPVVGSQ